MNKMPTFANQWTQPKMPRTQSRLLLLVDAVTGSDWELAFCFDINVRVGEPSVRVAWRAQEPGEDTVGEAESTGRLGGDFNPA
jgi:hypothetical protein